MLSDDDTAVGDKGLSCGTFLVDIEPGAGVLNFHNNVRNDALDAKEETSVAGNNLCIRISAYITDLDIAIGIKSGGNSFLGQGSVVNELFQFQSRYNAGYITAFVAVGESICEIVKSADGSEVAGHGNELNVRIVSRHVSHEGLMAVAVGDNQVAAGSYKVDGSV